MEFYGFTGEEAERAIAVYRERFAPVGIFENQVYPGIPQMLERLYRRGTRLAVASSKPIGFVKQILAHFDIEKYFDVVVGSELDGTRGTKEEVVEEALGRLGILTMPVTERHVRCAMTGDRKFDIQGARACGLTGVGVRFGFAEEGELEEAGAEYIAETVAGLAEFLLRKA